MRKCSQCKDEKPFSNFYVAPGSGKVHSMCDPCRKRWGSDWQRANPASVRQARKRWEAEHPEEMAVLAAEKLERRRVRMRETSKAWRERNPEKAKGQAERRKQRVRENGREAYYKHRLAMPDRLRIEEDQGHACAICRRPFAEAKPHVDHCHSTKLVRGLLCPACNLRLGWYEFYAAAVQEYQERNPAKRLGITAESKSPSGRRKWGS